ncbi:protocadherin Fat 4-like [Haliotis asinina]|uniref:protocadherin Fat 4-like n=1 Tax=Haliotis asinina TaxID=109174 RepID=UPI003531CFD4
MVISSMLRNPYALQFSCGRWEQLLLSKGTIINLADVGFSPIHVHWLMFGIQACENLIITFAEALDNSKGYVMVYLGYQENNYTLLIPSTHCDETGQCSPTDYIEGHFLDCDNPRYFWMKWDNHGILELGTGYIIGEGMFLHTNYSGEFHLNSVTFTVNHDNGGVALVNIDSRPKFISPSADGTHNLIVDETADTGVEIFTVEAKDPENDNVTYSVVGDYTDMFNITGNILYNIRPLDYETRCSFDVTISASDRIGTTNTTLTIRIGDVIDERPEVIITPVAIPEELAIGTAVDGGFLVRDQDKNDTEHFYITGPHSDYFTVLEDWKFEIMKRIDYENGSKFMDMLILTVIDSGGLNTSAYLNITIMDMNDNPPVFSSSVYYASISENSGPDTPVVTVTCTDDDSGSNGDVNITIQSGDDINDPVFSMKNGTLQLLANGSKIDYESLADRNYTYVLTIMAEDKPTADIPNTAYAVVIVTVKAVNEHAPVWDDDLDPIPVTVQENLQPGSPVIQLIATDEDALQDGIVKFKMKEVKDDSGTSLTDVFAIHPDNGLVTIVKALDRDTVTGGVAYYNVTITACDQGIQSKETTKNITIEILNVNDNPPAFINFQGQVTVAENNAKKDDIIVNVTGNDVDGDPVTLSIVGGDTNYFYNNKTSIMALQKLDFENQNCFMLIIQLSDGTFDVNETLAITITDVIDEPPTLIPLSPGIVLEDLPLGTVIGGVFLVTDSDKEDVLTYTLTGADAKYFNMDNTTGTLTMLSRLDVDTMSVSYLDNLTIEVQDVAGLKDVKALNLTIVDVDDNSPTFSENSYTITVTENSTTGTILLLNCTDPDKGLYGQFNVSIVSGDAGNVFSVGGLELTVSGNVDYESLQDQDFKYILTLKATAASGGVNPKTAATLVIVEVLPANEFSPEWNQSTGIVGSRFADITVYENATMGTLVGTFAATDADLGNDGMLEYSVLTLTSSSGKVSGNPFQIDAANGELRTSADLDRDVGTGGVEFYNITIHVSDGGNPQNSIQANFSILLLNVNDNAPTLDVTASDVVVREDVNIGDVIYSFSDVSDKDGDTVIISVNGNASDTFEVQTGNLRLRNSLDYEEETCFTVSLTATDGQFETQMSLTIKVLDVVDEAPIITVLNPLSLPEGLSEGVRLGKLFDVVDKDANDNLTYSLQSNSGIDYFTIDPILGVLTILKAIDRDGPNGILSVTMNITVTDSANNSDTKPLVIDITDVNDNVPDCSMDVHGITLMENVPENVTLVRFTCTDKDNDGNDTATLVLTNEDVLPFKVDGMSLVTTNMTVDLESLGSNSFDVQLTFTDTPNAGRSNSFTFHAGVNVVGINEYAPVWNISSPSITVSEDEEVGTILAFLTATDMDAGPDGDLIYNITNITDDTGMPVEDVFIIHPTTGAIQPAKLLDGDAATGGSQFYSVELMATDQGLKAMNGTTNFTIFITNINDNPPMFLDFARRITVPENTGIDDVITNITGFDADMDDLTITLIEGDVDYFYVNGTALRLKKAVDHESQECYMLSVSMSDGDFSVNESLLLNVSDVIDEPPNIETLAPVLIVEELPVGTVIGGVVRVTDLDKGDVLKYSLSGNHSSYLSVDNTTGEFQVRGRLDLESFPYPYLDQLTLTVVDQSGLNASQQLNLTIVDVDDNFPTFSSTLYTTSVKENTPNVSLLQLNCTDSDTGENGQFNVSIVSGDAGNVFSVRGLELTVSGNVDYESLQDQDFKYILTLKATAASGGVNPKTAATLVIVEVISVNEYPPKWEATDSATTTSGTTMTIAGTSVQENLTTTMTTTLSGSAAVTTQLATSPGAGNVSNVLETSMAKTETSTNGLQTGTDPQNKFLSRIYVFENATRGTLVMSVGATDEDAGKDGLVTYTIRYTASDKRMSDNSPFSIDALSGDVRVSDNLDRDKATGGVEYYILTIQAIDGGNPARSVEKNVTILLLNVNDNPPTLDTPSGIVTVPEDMPVGDVILNFTSETDIDGDDVTFFIVGGDAAFFQVANGSLRVLQKFNYEERTMYNVILNADDGVFATNVTMTVYITDVIDEAPVLTILEPVTIQEELAINTTLGGIFTVFDSDQNDNFTYSLEGNDCDYFSFDPSTNQLQIAMRIDRDGTAGVTQLTNLSMTVTDSSGATATQYFNVTILDIDDNPPVFSQIYYYSTIDENSSFVNILNLTVSDSDVASEKTLQLNIVDGDPGSLFNLTDSQLSVDGSNLDYENLADIDYTYTLTITTQGGTMTGTAVVVVAWSTPVDEMGYFPNITLYENVTVGTEVIRLTAADADKGKDGQLAYHVVDNGSSIVNTFTLDDDTGALRVSGYLDSDAATGGQNVYELSVSVTDMGNVPRVIKGKVKILVLNSNDNLPQVTSPVRAVRVLENATVGDDLLLIPTSDIDGDDVTLTIIEGGDVVEFRNSTLVLKTAVKDIPGSCPTVVIRASDGKYSVDYSYLVQVTTVNVDEASVSFVKTFTIAEETPIGTVLGGMLTVKSDGGSTLQYTLSGNGTGVLEMDYRTGEVTVKQRINRDGGNGLAVIRDVTIAVTDNLNRVISNTINITITDINDNVPTFSQSIYKVSVKENSTDGSVLTITCHDDDAGRNGMCVISLANDDNRWFSLSNNSLFVKGSDIDYDSLSDVDSYITLTLNAVDQSDEFPRFTSQATIEPVNEFQPVIHNETLNLEVKEDISIGSLVLDVTATDGDIGVDGVITYSLISVVDDSSKDATSRFEMSSTTGELRTTAVLDSDISTGGVSYYVIKYKVKDGGSPSKEVQSQMNLTLIPVNEYPPVIQNFPPRVDVNENAAMSSLVSAFNADDKDGDAVTFSVTGNLFRFSGSILTLSKKLDFGTDNKKMFTVSATDGKFTTSSSFTINVIKNNVEGVAAPKIRALSSPTLMEERPIGTVVPLFQSVEGGSPPLLFRLSGDDAEYFSIDTATGEMKLQKFVDYDNGTHVLDRVTLTVNDSAGQEDWVTFNIAIIDLNDNSPMCSQSDYIVDVPENTSPGKLLLTLQCSDLDDNQLGNFTSKLVSNGIFSDYVVSSDLSLYTGNNVTDFESVAPDSSRVLKVLLTDNPGGYVQLTSTVLITVKISPVNEFEPKWVSPTIMYNSTFVNVTVYDDVALGSVVTVYNAEDADAGQDGVINYVLKSVTTDTYVNSSDIFVLDATSGILRTAAILKSKGGTVYNVVVVARDNGSPSKSVEGAQRIVIASSYDNSPTVTQRTDAVNVFENATIGDVIHTLQGSDVKAEPFKVSNSLFWMNGTTLILNGTLDYEKERLYTLLITSGDGKDTTLTLNVVNINDEIPFIQTTGTIAILEEQPIGTVVGGVYSVTDRDEGDNLTYAIVGNNSFFSINTTTGSLTMIQVLDYERIGNTSLQLTFNVTDAVGHTASTTLTFMLTDINDNPPTCPRQLYNVNITEDSANFSSIFIHECSDVDTGSNGEITLSIKDGDTDNLFNVSDNQVTMGSVDYETLTRDVPTYSLTLAVSDNSLNEARRTAYVILVVMIAPRNEFAPIWTSPSLDDNTGQFPVLSLSEDVRPGTTVATFAASDQDRGPDGLVRYWIYAAVSDAGTDSMDKFTIDGVTGVLSTARNVDADIATNGSLYYDITIRAEDSSLLRNYTLGVQRIYLTNFNDNPPIFTKSLYTIQVTCYSFNGDLVSSVVATDIDNTNLYYSINGSSPYVYVNLTSGGIILIYTPAELGMKYVTSDILVVKVTDRGSPELTDYAVVYLLFTDCDRPTVSTTTSSTTTTTTILTTTLEEATESSTNGTTCSPPRGQVLELWATRTICGMLGVGLVGVIVANMRCQRAPAATVADKMSKQKKVAPRSILDRGNTMEKKFPVDNLIEEGTNNGPPGFGEDMLTSSAPVGHPTLKYNP